MRRAILLVCVVGALLAAAPVHAGEYQVSTCLTGDPVNFLFSPSAAGAGTFSPSGHGGCDATRGTLVTRVDGQRNGDSAAFAFCAPAGAHVKDWSLVTQTQWQGSGYQRRVDGGSCGASLSSQRSQTVDPSPSAVRGSGWQNWGADGGPSVRSLRLLTVCNACGGGFAVTDWRDLRVTISDPVPPTLTDPTGFWIADGWLRGSQQFSLRAHDSTGVRETRIEANGGQGGLVWNDSFGADCDFTRPGPVP